MTTYTAQSIEVLTGLDPVRKRPGMYTDTTRPNHLAQEVIDNSVDEALEGHARRVDVVRHEDGSLSVTDDGRGMPVDLHPELEVPAVAGIRTTPPAGGTFSHRTYRSSGARPRLGVGVVNALAPSLDAGIRRGGQVHRMAFRGGEHTGPQEVIHRCGRRNTGTRLRFLPGPQYFDSA